MTDLPIALVTARKSLFSCWHKKIVAWLLAPHPHNAATLWKLSAVKAVGQNINFIRLQFMLMQEGRVSENGLRFLGQKVMKPFNR